MKTLINLITFFKSSDRFYKFNILLLILLLKRKKNIYFILQNKFDLKIFNKKVGHKKTVYIPSSGVDFTEFRFQASTIRRWRFNTPQRERSSFAIF